MNVDNLWMKLAQEVNSQFCDQGFVSCEYHEEDCIMLILKDVIGAIEQEDLIKKIRIPQGIEDMEADAFVDAFENSIKDTFEEGLAKIGMRMLDLLVVHGKHCRDYIGGFVYLDHPEDTLRVMYSIMRDLTSDARLSLKLRHGMQTLLGLAHHLGVDLYKLIQLKLRYNICRLQLNPKRR
ncbi:hypothetical protein [uncultured Porphyromonas sp.]|uniref:hypothetical protein n=1 Tax=uncultured Porphyromonas sp. TaxID=159274 RepID=UPI00261DE21A|nr:hypothetical protein [uncultured Porphyromonas sp.]